MGSNFFKITFLIILALGFLTACEDRRNARIAEEKSPTIAEAPLVVKYTLICSTDKNTVHSLTVTTSESPREIQIDLETVQVAAILAMLQTNRARYNKETKNFSILP